jgi:hypothetical protein
MRNAPRFIRSADNYGRERWLSIDAIGSCNVGSGGDWYLSDFMGKKLGTAKPADFKPENYED